jgi:hypothetical protein
MMTTKAPMPGGGGSPSLVIEMAATMSVSLFSRTLYFSLKLRFSGIVSISASSSPRTSNLAVIGSGPLGVVAM